MAMTLTVSVVVPTFNRERYLGECLDSLLAQTAAPHEILVIDDGSDDGTAELVARYGSRVRYIYKENGGKPRAVNLGLELARGDLIWIFDDDDVAMPDAIASRIAALEVTPGAGFVYGPHYLGSDGADGLIVRGRLYQPPQYPNEQFFLEIMKNCFFHLATALVRREIYEALNGLDPDLFSGEDYDFQIRLARVAQPAYCSTPTFVFRQHSGVRGAKSVRYSAAQRSAVFKKYSLSVGLKLRGAVPLGEYLVPRWRGEELLLDRKNALLNRIHVMANHGCVLALIDDLTTLLTISETAKQLTMSDLNSISESIKRGWAYEACIQDWPNFFNALRPLKYLPKGRSAIFALARGVLVLAKSYPGTFVDRLVRVHTALKIGFAAVI